MKKNMTTTVIAIKQQARTVDDELDLLAQIHRLPGVEQVWLNGNSLNVVHEVASTTPDEVAGVLQRSGYHVMA